MPEFCQELSPFLLDIDLWLLSTEAVEAADLATLKACLSPQEQAQLRRMRAARGQRQFTLSRGCLRYLIGCYVEAAPESLSFTYGWRGKPALERAGSVEGTVPQFNLSHSGERLLVAVSGAASIRAVGVDLEVLRPVNHLSGLCRRCLTSAEADAVLALPRAETDQRFLRYWTGKEACLKALGLGIVDSMQRLELALNYPDLTPAPAPVEVTTQGNLEHPGQLYQWQPEPGYVGAIAVRLAPELTPNFRLYQTTPAGLICDRRGCPANATLG